MTPETINVIVGDRSAAQGCWQLASPVSLAATIAFDGTGARWFDTAPAHSWPHRVGDFSGSVFTGASCNCRTVEITPHGAGTHTESVGHLTADEHHVIGVLPPGLLPSLLLRVNTAAVAATRESSDYPPQTHDLLITAASVIAAWPERLPFAPSALVLATPARQPTPAYLTRECAHELVSRGIRHLVVDLPSLDRCADNGALTAHRIFFGLPSRGTQSTLPISRDALRGDCTVTELASIPETLAAGPGFLQIQAPAWNGDAIPSRPLWFALSSASRT